MVMAKVVITLGIGGGMWDVSNFSPVIMGCLIP